jgi:cell division protein FtsN
MSEFFQAHPMLLFGLEAAVALFLLIFIVVWTMGTAKKNPRPSRAPADHPSRREAQPSGPEAVSGTDQTAQETVQPAAQPAAQQQQQQQKQDSRPAP